MNDTLRIFALQADTGGSGHYRIKLPCETSRLAGVDVTISHDLPATHSLNDRDGSFTVHSIDVDVDVIIFQRPVLALMGAAIKQAQRQGIACVVEVDDDFHSLSRDNAAYYDVHPKWNAHSNWDHLWRATQLADHVTVSTNALARRYGGHGRVSVLRNCVPASIFEIQKTREYPARVGWTGTIHTHPHDLDVAGAHIGTVLERTGMGFTAIGGGSAVADKLYIRDSTDFRSVDWTDLERYYQTVADNIDIGIVPLEPSAFNDAKSYLKGLEMAALGIPFVASPVEEYRLFHDLGAARRLARKGLDWQKHIKALGNDAQYAAESEQVRASVKNFTYENNIGAWIDAWLDALEHRRKVST